ncbi:hypothetical protein LY78DRAFT_412935 [Colletotrichum sublineola]|nr:hypothetical protein LY78DRAFT_412935 [Colletotrichum sublineola]
MWKRWTLELERRSERQSAPLAPPQSSTQRRGLFVPTRPPPPFLCSVAIRRGLRHSHVASFCSRKGVVVCHLTDTVLPPD